MGTNNCLVLGEVGVGEEGDQASSGTHPGLPLTQTLPNQPDDQLQLPRMKELINEKEEKKTKELKEYDQRWG